MDDQDEVEKSIIFLLRESTPNRSVLIVQCDVSEFTKIAHRAHAKITSINLHEFAHCTSAEIIEIVRASLSCSDIGKRMSADIVLVQGIYEVALTNKSLPANVSSLPLKAGRKVCYLIDAMDRDARQALLRRDFLRMLGPTFFKAGMNFPFHKDPKRQERELKAYIKEIDELSKYVYNDDFDTCIDTWAVYENVPSIKTATENDIRRIVESYHESSVIDKLSLERDFYSLSSIADDIRLESTSSYDDVVHDKKSTQLFTRCGMHANLRRDMLARL